MTSTELKQQFLIELDAVASGAAPGFTDTEINKLLIKSEKDIIEQAVRIKDFNLIYPLVETDTGGLDAGYVYSNSYKVDLDSMVSNFLYYITSRTNITRTNPTYSGWIENDLIQRDSAEKFAITGFNYPYFKNPVVFFEQFNNLDNYPVISVMLDYYTIPAATAINFELTYVRKPNAIDVASVTSELPEALHKVIVSMAVQEAVNSLKTAKISTQ